MRKPPRTTTGESTFNSGRLVWSGSLTDIWCWLSVVLRLSGLFSTGRLVSGRSGRINLQQHLDASNHGVVLDILNPFKCPRGLIGIRHLASNQADAGSNPAGGPI